jgi:DNA-binding HxlR family transcriptional regulator
MLEHHQPPQGPATYSLTDAGRSLQPALEAIRDWWAKLEDDSDRASAAARTSAPAR